MQVKRANQQLSNIFNPMENSDGKRLKCIMIEGHPKPILKFHDIHEWVKKC